MGTYREPWLERTSQEEDEVYSSAFFEFKRVLIPNQVWLHKMTKCERKFMYLSACPNIVYEIPYIPPK